MLFTANGNRKGIRKVCVGEEDKGTTVKEHMIRHRKIIELSNGKSV